MERRSCKFQLRFAKDEHNLVKIHSYLIREYTLYQYSEGKIIMSYIKSAATQNKSLL